VRVAFDTNVLAYAEGLGDPSKQKVALALIERLSKNTVVIPVQVLGELFHVLVRKAGRSTAQARSAILDWRDAFLLVETSPAVMLTAADLATDHRLGIWDSVILSAASQADCRLLLSEDLQDGFTWGGTTVANPFALNQHALLKALLNES